MRFDPKAPRKKKLLAKAAKKVINKKTGRPVYYDRSRRGFIWFTPYVGKAARRLVVDMQRHYGCKPAYGGCSGFFTTALLKRLASELAPPKPKVVSPRWSWRGSRTRLTRTPRFFICHYSAGPASQTAADLHRIHLARGFLGLGYNAVIERDGTIVIGRGWGYLGAHTKGYNDQWAVCLPGDNSAPPTPEQLASLKWLIADRNKAAGRKLIVKGHNEMPGNATSCPGRFWPWRGVR